MHSLVLIAGFDMALWRPAVSPEFQTVVFIGSLLFVVLLAFLWAIFWRMPARRQHTHGRHPVSHHVPVTPLPERRRKSPLIFRLLRFKRRRHRRHHRLINPTLADADGLPPQRNEHPPA